MSLGCSQLAAVFGAHPFLTPYSLWARLTGRIPEDRGIYTAAGHLYEQAIRGAYLAGHPGYRWDGSRADYDAEPLLHRDVPLHGHPDGIITTAGEARWAADAKCYLARGLSGSRQVPAYVEYQLRGYMALLDVEYAQCVACWSLTEFGGRVAEMEITEHLYERDREIEEWLLSSLRQWWAEHVEADRPPVAGKRDLPALKSQRVESGIEVVLRPYLAPVVAKLATQREMAREHESHARAARSRAKPYEATIRQAMGAAERAACGEYLIERRVTKRGDTLRVRKM